MFHVAAFATSNAGYSLFFDKSCREVGGFEPVILGLGREWIGFASGLNYLAEWLRTINPDDVVLVCDRYDLIITAPLLPTLFAAYEAGAAAHPGREFIYISADINGLGQRLYWGKLNSHNCQLSSGSYVMKAGGLLKMFESILQKYAGPRLKSIDDQRHITEYLNEHESEISVGVDNTDHILLYPAGAWGIGARISYKYRPGSPYKSLYYDNKPIAIVHRPAAGDMKALLADLGYDKTEIAKVKNCNPLHYQLKGLPRLVGYYLKNTSTWWHNLTC